MNKYSSYVVAAGIALSFSSFAASPNCCLDLSSSLCAPKLPGGFYIGVTGYYLNPSETGLGQVTDSWQYNDRVSPTLSEFHSEDRSANIDYEWEWGFMIGYDIPCTAYNLEANYLHLENDTHAVNDTSQGNPVSFSSYFFPNAFLTIGAPTGTTLLELVSDGHLRYDLDQADIRLGRQFYNLCGGRFKVVASLGAKYAKLEHELSFNSPATISVAIPGADALIFDEIFRGAVKSDFEGIGPMLALDLHYGIGMGLGLVGHFNSALLAGKVDSQNFISNELTLVSTPGAATVVTTNRFERPSVNHIMPTAEAKAGVDYTFCFANRSSLTLEVGYHAGKYWESFNLLRGNLTTDATVPEQRLTGIETTSFSVRGPYAQATLHI